MVWEKSSLVVCSLFLPFSLSLSICVCLPHSFCMLFSCSIIAFVSLPISASFSLPLSLLLSMACLSCSVCFLCLFRFLLLSPSLPFRHSLSLSFSPNSSPSFDLSLFLPHCCLLWLSLSCHSQSLSLTLSPPCSPRPSLPLFLSVPSFPLFEWIYYWRIHPRHPLSSASEQVWWKDAKNKNKSRDVSENPPGLGIQG